VGGLAVSAAINNPFDKKYNYGLVDIFFQCGTPLRVSPAGRTHLFASAEHAFK
jgi:hypothetical protein